MPLNWLATIGQHEYSIFSQNGEDGIIQYIFDNIGTTDKTYVEFGCDGGHECHARLLTERYGWNGLIMDSGVWPNDYLKKEFITAENIGRLFRKYGVPYELDLLSIDIDGNDYWVRKAIGNNYRPRVIIHDYNGNIPPPLSLTIAYDPTHIWSGNDYATASLAAFVKLNKTLGYTLVYCETMGVNAFFIRDDLIAGLTPPPMEDLWRPLVGAPRYKEWRKRWVEVVLDDGDLYERIFEPSPLLGDHPGITRLPYVLNEEL